MKEGIELLIEDYERRIKNAKQLLKETEFNPNSETRKRIETKLGCYRSFLIELNKVLNK